MSGDWWDAAAKQGIVAPVVQSSASPNAPDWWAQAQAQGVVAPISMGATGVPASSVGADIAKSGATGLVKGVAGLAGLPMDAVNLAHKVAGNIDPSLLYNLKLGLNSKGQALGANPEQDKTDMATLHTQGLAPVADLPGGTSDVMKFLYPDGGAPYQAQTAPGKFAEDVGQIVPSVATGTEFKAIPGIASKIAAHQVPAILPTAANIAGDVARVAIPSAAAAGGGEAAQAVGLPAAVGQIPSLLLARAPSMLLPNAGRMAKDALGDLTPQEITAAQTLQQRGQAIGVPLMGQESFNKPALTTLSGNVLASPTGAVPIGNFLAQRPPQVAAARSNMLDAVAPPTVPPTPPLAPSSIPTAVGPQSASDAIQEAADARLRMAAQTRTNAASPGYEAAAGQDIPATDHQNIVDAARTAAAQAGAGTLARTRLTQLADNLQANGPNIGLLDSTRKSFRDNLTNAALPDAADSETARLMTPVLNQLRDRMAAASPEYAQGLGAYKEASNSFVAPLENGPIGTLAQGSTNPAGQLNTLFSPAQAGPGEVRNALNELGLANPNVPGIATRRFVEDASNVPSNMPTQAGARIFNALMGRPDDAANLGAAMRGTELASGQAPGAISGPVNDTLSVFDATRRAPQLNSATAGRTLANAQAGASLPGSLLDVISAEPTHGAAQWLRGNLQRKTYRTLADTLTDPDAVNALLKLSRQIGPSPMSGALLSSALLGAQGQAGGNP